MTKKASIVEFIVLAVLLFIIYTIASKVYKEFQYDKCPICKYRDATIK
jgi:hypothetical protein